jgi:hypothetical protein
VASDVLIYAIAGWPVNVIKIQKETVGGAGSN